MTAADGQEGLAAATSGRPDPVLPDVMMPRPNGYQTCRALKPDPDLARCPFLMLTAKDETTDRFWAGEVGADAFSHEADGHPPAAADHRGADGLGVSTLTIILMRLRGLWDAWRGKTGWEKFARVGFREGVAPAHV